MTTDWTKVWAKKPIIGMLHLGPLPGSPNANAGASALWDVLEVTLRDAAALAEGGVHALMLENFGDVPFFAGRVPAATIASMTRVAAEVRRLFPGLPLGINVLRNDGLSALAVAVAVDAEFIRVNVLSGARVTDQGLIQGIAADLLRERKMLGAGRVQIFADVDVKHSAPLAARPLRDEVEDTVKRGLADAVVVSGRGTGAAVDSNDLAVVAGAAGKAPVVIGSGVTAESLPTLAAHADGFIVGTALKKNGISTAHVERARVEALMRVHAKLA